jgi:hypothetical protein
MYPAPATGRRSRVCRSEQTVIQEAPEETTARRNTRGNGGEGLMGRTQRPAARGHQNGALDLSVPPVPADLRRATSVRARRGAENSEGGRRS